MRRKIGVPFFIGQLGCLSCTCTSYSISLAIQAQA